MDVDIHVREYSRSKKGKVSRNPVFTRTPDCRDTPKKHDKYIKFQLRIQPRRKGFYVRAEGEEHPVCPVCIHSMKKKGRRKRKVIMLDGATRVLKIRRFKCCHCGRIHHELPDGVVPYKRHGATTIESIIAGDIEYVCCEQSTISRITKWWINIQLYINGVRGSILEKYGVSISQKRKLPEIVRMLVNTNLWPGTRSALKPG